MALPCRPGRDVPLSWVCLWGVKMTYAEKLQDPRWQQKRREILSRDGHTCQRCFEYQDTLQVHHLNYHPNCEPWDYSDDDLITLCESCHKVTPVTIPEADIRNPWLVYERIKKKISRDLPSGEYERKILALCKRLSL